MVMSVRDALARLIDLFGPQAGWDPTKLYGNLFVAPSGNVLLGGLTDDTVSKVQIYGPAAASSNPTLALWAGTAYMKFMPDAAVAGYNPIVQAGDTVLAYSNGTEGSGTLAIVPWSTTAAGLRMAANGLLMQGGGITVNSFAGDGYAQFRAIQGNYGAMIRNDGTNCYLLSTASGTPAGTWNTYRPFYWNFANGAVFIDQTGSGVSFGTAASTVNQATFAYPVVSTFTTATAGYGVYRSSAEIGIAWNQWNSTGTPAMQVDSPTNSLAYMGMRWTQWGTRHLAAISAYASSSNTAAASITFNFGSNANSFTFYDGGAATFAGALTQNSDYRIKTNIEVIDPQESLAQVMRLVPKEYDRTEEHHLHGRQPGFIAHEMQEVFPLLVKGEKDAVMTVKKLVGDTRPFQKGEEPDDYVPPVEQEVEVPDLQSVNYIGVIPYLVSSIQALKQELDEERVKRKNLQRRVDELIHPQK